MLSIIQATLVALAGLALVPVLARAQSNSDVAAQITATYPSPGTAPSLLRPGS